jgi:pimeloyl-ACP methyl ester carboxylesterase
MTTLIYLIIGLALAYLLLSLVFTYAVQQYPRKPVTDTPDWGTVLDAKVATDDGGFLETWRIEPSGKPKGIVLFMHGWSRNRDRMVPRARMFGKWGYVTVLFSARDHGNSSSRKFMNAMKFAEDIETVLDWIGKPVILYGHSAGSAGAVIAAARNPHRIKRLFLEASYAYTEEALLSLYRWVNPFFGKVFGPAIILWLNFFHGNSLDRVSPARLAPDLNMPVMLIHGENDRRFPVAFAEKLYKSFPPGRAVFFVAPGAGHSDASRAGGYQDAVKTFLNTP